MMFYPYFLKKFGYEPLCNLSLFVLLRSGKISEWNNIRAQNNYNEVYLQTCVGISNVDLKGINLSNTHFEGVTFENVNLEAANLSNAHFEGAKLVNVFFDYGAKFNCSHFEGSNLEKFIKEFHHLPICSYPQYKLLRACSKKKDSSEWNEWRKKRPWEKIYLQKIIFKEGYLNDINFSVAHLECANFDRTSLVKANFNYAYLEEASINYAHLEESRLYGSHLNKATLEESYLNNAFLGDGIFEGADLGSAHLEGAKASGAKFKGANLRAADLSNVDLWEVNLEKTKLLYAILEGTSISGGEIKTNLKGANFTGVTVNGKTIIQNCDIDEKTNFSMVGLDYARIEPKLLTALKTNIRRVEWGKYFKKNNKSCLSCIKTAPMRFFWWLSDYGSSSERIFISIIIAILFFTNIYLTASVLPNNLIMDLDNKIISSLSGLFIVYIRAICFAISAMFTFGLGNLNSNAINNDCGNGIFLLIMVALNFIFGYFFIALLVNRFGVILKSFAPAKENKKKDNMIFYCCIYILSINGFYLLVYSNSLLNHINTIIEISVHFILIMLYFCAMLYILYHINKLFCPFIRRTIKLYFRFAKIKITKIIKHIN